jgi:hypothetical protein
MKINGLLREKTAHYIFYMGIIIEVMLVLIDKSAYTNPIEGQIFRLTFLLFFIKVCLTKYSFREYALIAFFLVLGAVSYFATGRNEIIRVVMFVASCKDVDMVKCLKVVFWVTLTGCLVLVFLSLFGILGTMALTQDYGRGSVETRYVLGLGHPNSLHCMFFMLVLLGLYLYGSRMKIYEFVVLFLVNIGMFLLTKSKTGMLVTALAVIFAGLLIYIPVLQKKIFIYGLSMLLLAGCVGIAWGAAAFSKELPYYDALRKFDRLLSDRIINLYYGSMSHAGTLPTWTLLGVTENEYYFDMGWVRLFYWYGILPAAIYVVVLALLIWELYRKKEYMGILVLDSLFIYTLVEAHIISVYLARDYTLFLIGMHFGAMFHADKGVGRYFWQVPKALFQQKLTLINFAQKD